MASESFVIPAGNADPATCSGCFLLFPPNKNKPVTLPRRNSLLVHRPAAMVCRRVRDGPSPQYSGAEWVGATFSCSVTIAVGRRRSSTLMVRAGDLLLGLQRKVAEKFLAPEGMPMVQAFP